MQPAAVLAELSQRLLDASQQGQGRLAELRAAADGQLELHQMLQGQLQQLSSAMPVDGHEAEDGSGELEELRGELTWLRGQLLEARERLEEAEASRPGQGEAGGDQELAESLGETQQELEETRQQLLETQQQLQAQMEQQEATDAGDEQTRELLDELQRRAEEAEQAVSERDRQVGELQASLGELQASMGELRAGDGDGGDGEPQAAPDAEILSERDKLKQLQDQWHDKLRKAELEISVERARVARERTEMEEKIQLLESEIVRLQEAGGGAPDAGNGGGGRWLARLGLNRND